ncbi:hypothetical protein ACUN5M_000332 [Acinetobacter baumannii]
MSEFKVGDWVVLKSSSQNKVMTIQEIYKEFIRAYWDKEHYSFAHQSNFRSAKPNEIKAGFKEGTKEFENYWYGRSEAEEVKAMELLNDMGDDFPIENHISPLCKSKDV